MVLMIYVLISLFVLIAFGHFEGGGGGTAAVGIKTVRVLFFGTVLCIKCRPKSLRRYRETVLYKVCWLTRVDLTTGWPPRLCHGLVVA